MPLTLPSRGWTVSLENEDGDTMFAMLEGAIMYFPSFQIAVAHLVKYTEFTADEIIDSYCIEQEGVNNA